MMTKFCRIKLTKNFCKMIENSNDLFSKFCKNYDKNDILKVLLSTPTIKCCKIL